MDSAAQFGKYPEMKTVNKHPKLEPRELRDGSGWYALVIWGDRPSEQVGGFASETEARHWIDHSAAAWVRERLAAESILGYGRM